MRHIYLMLVAFITVVVVTFGIQNIGSVTVSFLHMSLTVPLSVLFFVTYFVGMFTGGMVISAIRSWVRGATKPVNPVSDKP